MKNKKLNNLEKIIWEDKKETDQISLAMAVFIFFTTVIFIFNAKPQVEYYRLFLIPIALFAAFLLYTQVRRRRIFITKEGVRMGNLVHWADDKLILKQKPSFFRWSEIEYLKIVVKSYHQGVYGGRNFHHVHLRTKTGNLIDCLVHDPDGFLGALKSLNKLSLLDKKFGGRSS